MARIARREIEPKIGKRLLNETTRADWTGLVAAKRKLAPAMASSMFRIVASFLSYAEAQGWIAAPLLPRKGAAMLCALAVSELRAAVPENEIGSGYRLFGRNRGSGLRGFSKLKARVDYRIAASRAQAGVTDEMPPWHFHDLRRTARTGMARLVVPREHAEAAVNHISARWALERTYDRHAYAPEIATALGEWQMHVSELVKLQPMPIEHAGGAAGHETHPR